MGFWESAFAAISRVTGTAAGVRVELETESVAPGATLPVTVVIKNGPATLGVYEVALDVTAVEEIELPRYADDGDVMEDEQAEGNDRRRGRRRRTRPATTARPETTFDTTISVAPERVLDPGREYRFKTAFTVPADAQPTYAGRRATHSWWLRGRIEIVGAEHDSGWIEFRVTAP